MPLKPWIKAVVAGQNLSQTEMKTAMDTIMGGEATPAQIGALLVGLRMKGETTDEIAGAAEAMRARVHRVEHGFDRVLDTCGTGGDGAVTFNISTAVSFVCAGAGVRVGKHGNRAISSRSGSADVLEALGVTLLSEPEQLSHCLETVGLAFLFAPALHPAMKHVAGPRREMGVRSMMNLLGPITNPANATHQLVGIYDRARVATIAEVLHQLGTQRAIVVHGHNGLDEVNPCGPTDVAIADKNGVQTQVTRPEDVGLTACTEAEIAGGDSAENAVIIRDLLDGKPGAARTAVVLNAGWALFAAEASATPAEGVVLAQQVIDDGRARAIMNNLIGYTTA